VYLLQCFRPQTRDVTAALLAAVAQTYRSLAPVTEELVREAATHIGAHLVAWTPRVPWGTAEETKAVVEIGTRYLLESNRPGAEGWFRECIIADLYR
jgi:hypothetical protein